MKKLLAILGLLAIPSLALAAPILTLTSAASPAGTGVNGEDLADTPKTDSINMQSTYGTNQLTLGFRVTPGTTTDAEVKCEGSFDNTDWLWIEECPNGVCVVWERNYDITEATQLCTVAPLTDYCWLTNVPSNYPYIRCQADDAADGTGTVVITGARWKQ